MNSEWQHMFGGLNSPVANNNQVSNNQLLTINSVVNNSPSHQQTTNLNDAASLSEPEGSYIQCESFIIFINILLEYFKYALKRHIN